MGRIEEINPKYCYKTRRILVSIHNISISLTREDAESLAQSLNVGLYEASLYDSYEKERDKKTKAHG